MLFMLALVRTIWRMPYYRRIAEPLDVYCSHRTSVCGSVLRINVSKSV